MVQVIMCFDAKPPVAFQYRPAPQSPDIPAKTCFCFGWTNKQGMGTNISVHGTRCVRKQFLPQVNIWHGLLRLVFLSFFFLTFGRGGALEIMPFCTMSGILLK